MVFFLITTDYFIETAKKQLLITCFIMYDYPKLFHTFVQIFKSKGSKIGAGTIHNM